MAEPAGITQREAAALKRRGWDLDGDAQGPDDLEEDEILPVDEKLEALLIDTEEFC